MPDPTTLTGPAITVDRIIGVNHEGNNIYLRATGERYYYKDKLRSATVPLRDADLTAATVFYIFRAWFTTEELDWRADGITFHGLKENAA